MHPPIKAQARLAGAALDVGLSRLANPAIVASPLRAWIHFVRAVSLVLFAAQVALGQESHPQPPPPPPSAKTVKCTGREVPQFTDITAKAGIRFSHDSSSANKYVVES